MQHHAKAFIKCLCIFCVLLRHRKGVKSEWFLDFVIFTTPYNNRCYKLPVNRWLTDNTPALALRSAKGEKLKLRRGC